MNQKVTQEVSSILRDCCTYSQDARYRTHLHHAARTGQLITLYSLIKEGENVNCRTCNGVTPLHLACWTGQVYCARHLIKAGAKVNSLDVAGQSPLAYASAHGHSECVRLLLDSGAIPDLEDQRVPPLHAAAFEGSLGCVNQLLSSGANLEAKSMEQETPLLTACKQGNVLAAAALLQAGAQVHVTTQHTKDTPLHIAATKHYLKLARLLLEFGAEVDAINAENKKPSQLIKRDGFGFEDMVNLFQYFEGTPKTLTSLCRLELRDHLGPRRLNHIPDLPLPEMIKRYLKCDDMPLYN